MKVCSKCGRELDESEFSRDSNSKDGLQGYCRDCRKTSNKQYYIEHRDEVLEQQKQYNAEHRDELLEYYKQYKDSKINPTIYYIENIVTGRTYVGATTRPFQRPKVHKNALKSQTHPAKLMQEDYNKYGWESFVFRVLEDNVPKDKLLDVETNWIQDLQPAYNTRKVSA